jgi:regulator of protease activity HflC (stomatin/prohibitin superfamily)
MAIGLSHVVLGLVITSLAMAFLSSRSDLYVTVGGFLLVLVLVAYVPRAFLALRTHVLSQMKSGTLSLAFVSMVFLTQGCSYSRVEPGHVGIRVHLYGGAKGVDFDALGVGAYWYNPVSTTIYKFPTYVQTAVWTADPTEGHATNEELTFNTREGMVVRADISLSYHLDPTKVPAFFDKFRTDDLNTFTHGFLRNIARDAFNDLGPHYTVEEVYGEKKEELRRSVIARIQGEVSTYGVILEQFGYIGALRLPSNVEQALNNKIQATQEAMRIQNEIAQAEASAKKAIAVANGSAEARVKMAEAEAKANRIVSESLTPALVQYEAVKKWNGARPMVETSGSSNLLLSPTLPGMK